MLIFLIISRIMYLNKMKVLYFKVNQEVKIMNVQKRNQETNCL
jgi:hypothetical protein